MSATVPGDRRFGDDFLRHSLFPFPFAMAVDETELSFAYVPYFFLSRLFFLPSSFPEDFEREDCSWLQRSLFRGWKSQCLCDRRPLVTPPLPRTHFVRKRWPSFYYLARSVSAGVVRFTSSLESNLFFVPFSLGDLVFDQAELTDTRPF